MASDGKEVVPAHNQEPRPQPSKEQVQQLMQMFPRLDEIMCNTLAWATEEELQRFLAHPGTIDEEK